MNPSNPTVVLICLGILAITVIDTVGAIASRRLHIRYSLFSLLSFATYVSIGFFGSKMIDLNTAVTIAIAIGIYDATIGLWLSIKLKANMGITEEQLKKIVGIQSIMVMIITAVIFSTIGYALTYI